MPEVVMSHVTQTSARCEDIKGHINYLRQSMDQVAGGLDGFSDSESSVNDGDDDDTDVSQARSKSRSSNNSNRRHVCKKELHIKNGLVARRKALKLSRLRSVDGKSSVQSSAKSVPHIKRSISETHTRKDNHSLTGDTYHNDKDNGMYDPVLYQPLRAGQDEADVDVPIMSPPPVEENSKFEHCKSASSRYSRPLSLLLFMTSEDDVKCDFEALQYADVTKSLLNMSDRKTGCICTPSNSPEVVFGGWEVTQKNVKSKNNRKRKSIKPPNSDVAFDRLTGAGNYDKFPTHFQHFRNTSHYIEAYRILHTVDNVGRPHTSIISPAYIKKPPDTTADPYYSRMRSTICAMASTCDLYSLLAVPRREPNSRSIVSDNDSGNEKTRSDEEIYEDNIYDSRGYTVKDRGKILNLAPVRECVVPGMTFKEKQEQFQQNYVALNQYLNLMTPPMPAKGLQFEIDEARMRRNGFRIANAGDNNLFPACTPRRGARPLRLGSAEFLKPGASHGVEHRWSLEKRHSAGSACNPTTSTLPGTIIVGSTVIPQAASLQSRTKNGHKILPYVQFQRDQQQARTMEKPHTPPQHVAGTKLRQCERVTDLTSSSTDKNRLTYTHAPPPEKQVLQFRSASVVDWDDKTKYAKREKTLKLDVNHLGIRGHTFKPDDQLTIYKHRRTASLKS